MDVVIGHGEAVFNHFETQKTIDDTNFTNNIWAQPSDPNGTTWKVAEIEEYFLRKSDDVVDMRTINLFWYESIRMEEFSRIKFFPELFYQNNKPKKPISIGLYGAKIMLAYDDKFQLFSKSYLIPMIDKKHLLRRWGLNDSFNASKELINKYIVRISDIEDFFQVNL